MDTDTNYFSTSLPHLGDITVDLPSLAFPESWTRFHVPILKDKPQNPIMDTLQTLDHQLLHPVDTISHYGENKVPRISEQSDPDSVDNDLWTMIKEEATSPVCAIEVLVMCNWSLTIVI